MGIQKFECNKLEEKSQQKTKPQLNLVKKVILANFNIKTKVCYK